MRNRLAQLFTTALVLAAAGALAGCDAPAQPSAADAEVTEAAQAGPLGVGGTWRYAEESSLVLPGDLIGGLEGPVLHLTCVSPAGVLTISQTGTTISGTLVHPESVCHTKGGMPVPAPWPLPYTATLTGHVTGRAVYIDQVDDAPPGVRCPKYGSLRVAGGDVVEIRTNGSCDLAAAVPFRPATATNSGTAVRP